MGQGQRQSLLGESAMAQSHPEASCTEASSWWFSELVLCSASTLQMESLLCIWAEALQLALCEEPRLQEGEEAGPCLHVGL